MLTWNHLLSTDLKGYLVVASTPPHLWAVDGVCSPPKTFVHQTVDTHVSNTRQS